MVVLLLIGLVAGLATAQPRLYDVTMKTTGIAFHYDQPDASPPQAVLVAVPPRLAGQWTWDDLVHTLDETLDLAMNRMVELEHLELLLVQRVQLVAGLLHEVRLTAADESSRPPVSGRRSRGDPAMKPACPREPRRGRSQ